MPLNNTNSITNSQAAFMKGFIPPTENTKRGGQFVRY